MATNALKNLKGALDDGLGIVTRVWEYKTKDWVTSVFAADVNSDGKPEVIACSRDGRVYLLSEGGDLIWERIIGTKAWVGTAVASSLSAGETDTSIRIIAGTRDGKIYVLDKDGKAITKDGQSLAFDTDGRTIDAQQGQNAYWYDPEGYVIRQVFVDPQHPSEILIGSEDRSAYAFEYETGEQLWQFQTNEWVRAVFSYDINGDGQTEILVGSLDRYLYVLDRRGQLLTKHLMEHSIHRILATDVDLDGQVEVLVTTDGKDLIALTYCRDEESVCGHFIEKWCRTFHDRLRALCVTDIDGDGNKEIIASSDDKRIYILDAQGNIIWRHNHKYRVFSIYAYDIDNDGSLELLLGTEHDRVRVMRVRLRRDVERKVSRYYRLLGRPNPADIAELSNEQRTLLQDILSLNTREFVTFKQVQGPLSTGDYLDALSILLKLEQQKVEALWQKSIPYMRVVCLRHIMGESKHEIIVGTSTGDIYAFHNSGRRNWYKQLHDHIVDVQTGYIDHHKQEEIVVCSSDHHVYVLGDPQKQKPRDVSIADAWMSSLCVIAPDRQSIAEIIIGSEDKKLYVYGSDLQKPIETIFTEEGVRIVRAHTPSAENTLEIVAASLGNRIYAYTRGRKLLWTYDMRDRIRAVYIKDVNNDGKVEVLIGSEDRNIHVLDDSGHLLWRYYLPDSVLTIDAADVDNDHSLEIFVGCADGYLYVFNKEGELLWTYQAKDRIRAIRVGDIDEDGQVEIIVGTEDQLEVLRVANQRKLNEKITECWTALCRQQSMDDLVGNLLHSTDPYLQAFALEKLAEQCDCPSGHIATLETLIKEGTLEVRKALAFTVTKYYPTDVTWARLLLHQLSIDSERDVINAVLAHLPMLINHDREYVFSTLRRILENPDRFVRRMVIRTLHQLIDASKEKPLDTHQEIFSLLLIAAQDKESVWIRQEAARTLAHLLNQNDGKLIVYVHMFVVKHIDLYVLRYIAQVTTNLIVKPYLNAVIAILSGLDENNAPERLQRVSTALEALQPLMYGKDTHLIYAELHRLFTIQILADIEDYHCTLNVSQFTPNNQFARIILDIFNKLSIISRPLKMYVWRQGVQDRQASLLETLEAIEQMRQYIEQQYSLSLLNEPITSLPDHRIFVLLLNKWKKLVQKELNELRGNAQLTAELQTKDVRNEEQISIWLTVKNIGRGWASSVKITLLHSERFAVVGSDTFETEVMLPQEEIIAEFTLNPHSTDLKLEFELTYNDGDNTTKIRSFEESLLLRESYQEFRYIPNPYSTGTPTHDTDMFYGRERDMEYLENNLTREAKSVIVLYGQRRSGKTTMLLQLINASIQGEYIPVLIDLQRFVYHIAIDTLLHRMASSIVQAMRRKNILSIVTPELSSFKEDPTYTFDVFLDHVEEQRGGRKLILMVDEFEILEDKVTKGVLQPEIFEYLRNIVQHRHYINFLFSGTHKITKFTKWYRSIFFNSALHYRLSKLSEQGAEDLIRKPVEGFLEYEPLTVKKIRQLTDDQPYLIHLMCRAIIDYCNDRGKTYATINDVNIASHEVMQTGQFHFDWLWDQITPEERVALAAIAEGGKEEGHWFSFAEIEEIYRRLHILSKHEYILEALKTLIEADIVESTQSDAKKTRSDTHKFRIPVGLTRSWLLKEHPLEVVRKEMND